MKIISKFRDYYDSVQMYGQDSSLLYLREQKTKIVSEDSINTYHVNVPGSRGWKNYVSVDLSVIYFCGKPYPLVRTRNHTGYFGDPKKEKVFYSFDDFKDRFPRADELSYGKRYSLSYDASTHRYWSSAAPIPEWFERDHGDGLELHHKFKAPIILKTYCGDLVINPELNDYSFVTQVDPHTAHQEISMYLGGVLRVGEPDTVEISDDIRASKHGFDEYSFRADKGSGPKRKQKKK